MADNRQLPLHEFLKEDQEPFYPNSYNADKRSLFRKASASTNLQLKKRRRPVIPETCLNRGALCKHACFLSFQKSPDVRKSPFPDFQSPAAAKSPWKSSKGAVFLNVPPRTAAILAEAAMRIQSKNQSKSNGAGFGLFGSFLQRLKEWSRSKKRNIGNNVPIDSIKHELREKVEEEIVRLRCEEKSMDLDQASTSSCCAGCSEEMNGDFDSRQSFDSSPFRFSLHKSPSSAGTRTPEFCSPAASPVQNVKQEKVNLENGESQNVQAEGEEKEQCSPVSVLDPPFEDFEHEESGDAEELSSGLECSYANIERAKQQLLYRLRRFEKLADLDPMELERKLMEGSDGEEQGEKEESDDDDEYEPLPLNRNHQNPDTSLPKLFNQSSIRGHSSHLSTDIVCFGRISNSFDSLRKVEFQTIDMMISLDFKNDFEGWKKFPGQKEETVVEMELAVFEFLMEELSDELHHMHVNGQELEFFNPARSV